MRDPLAAQPLWSAPTASALSTAGSAPVESGDPVSALQNSALQNMFSADLIRGPEEVKQLRDAILQPNITLPDQPPPWVEELNQSLKKVSLGSEHVKIS